MTNEQIIEIIERYKLRIPPTVYYDLLADVQKVEEEQEPTTKNNLGVDAISREQALNEFCIYNPYDSIGVDKVRSCLKALPPITPIRPKGHWIMIELPARDGHVCSECGDLALSGEYGDEQLTDFCPNCGADMREVRE